MKLGSDWTPEGAKTAQFRQEAEDFQTATTKTTTPFSLLPTTISDDKTALMHSNNT